MKNGKDTLPSLKSFDGLATVPGIPDDMLELLRASEPPTSPNDDPSTDPNVGQEALFQALHEALAPVPDAEPLYSTLRDPDFVLGDGIDALADATREFRFSTDQVETSLPGRTFGNFRILEPVGNGTFGTVYRAEQIHLRKVVAIKILHFSQQTQPQAVERFQREGGVMSSLRHENIVSFYDFGQLHDVGFYMVMEYLDGEELGKHFEADSKWTLPRIQSVISGLCDALSCVHTHGLVHRDLKPANIMLCKAENGREQVKLLDFGIAGYADGRSNLTGTGAFLGTAQYVAPEQALGQKNIDGRADLYSLTILLFRMLTGKLPFDAPYKMDIIIKHVHQAAPKLADLASWKSWCPPLEAFIQQALAKEPAQRPQDAKAFKMLCLQALQQQEAFERQENTVFEKKYEFGSNDDLSAYVAEHGELPGFSSSTMRLDLSEGEFEQLQALSPFSSLRPESAFQWGLFWLSFVLVIGICVGIWMLFRGL